MAFFCVTDINFLVCVVVLQLLDVSGASALQAAVPHSQLFLLDDCGHTIALERPRKAAQLVMDFLSAQEVHSKDTDKKIS